MNEKMWFTLKEAALIFGRPEHVLRRACHAGEIKYRKIGRLFLIHRTQVCEPIHEQN